MSTKNTTDINFVLDALKKYMGFKRAQELADYLGVNKSTISTWKKRGVIGDPDLVMSKCPGVLYSFLRTGTGPMLESELQGVIETPPELFDHVEQYKALDDIARMVLDRVLKETRGMNSEEQRRFFMDTLARAEKKGA